MKNLVRFRKIFYCRKELWLELKKYIDLTVFRKDWRKANSHNGTIAKNKFDAAKVKVGKGTYGALEVIAFDNPKEGLDIGNYCSIAGGVTFMLGGMHPIHRITTYPYALHVLHLTGGGLEPTHTKGKITVEDDVWICHRVLILSGVTIGRGSIIGAGSVVTKDIPPYSIYAGGRIIKRRFEPNIADQIKDINLDAIQYLKKSQYEYLMKNDISQDNIEKIAGWF